MESENGEQDNLTPAEYSEEIATAEYAGIEAGDGQDELSGKEIVDAIDEEILARAEEAAEKELPITHVKSMVNKRVFPITPDLMKRKDLVPCTKEGKLVHDHRCF